MKKDQLVWNDYNMNVVFLVSINISTSWQGWGNALAQTVGYKGIWVFQFDHRGARGIVSQLGT